MQAFAERLPSLNSIAAIDAALEELKQLLVQVAKSTVGGEQRLVSGPQLWYSHELARLCRDKNRLLRAAAAAEKQNGITEASRRLRQEARALKKSVAVAARAAKRKRWAEVCRRLDESTDRAFWHYVRNSRRSASGLPRALRRADGQLEVDQDRILEVAMEFWRSTCSENTHLSERWNEEAWQSMKERAQALVFDEQDARSLKLDLEHVVAAVAQVSLHKAGGVDGILPWMVKLGGEAMALVLWRIYSAMWDKCYIPAEWKRALVVPIFKKGDPCEPGNYRPISLLCVLGKVLSRAVNDMLYDIMEEEGLLPDEQGGFRRERGCPEMFLGLHSLVENRRLRGKSTHLCFVDVVKAYDTISRSGLALRLFELGTPSKLLAMVREWYTGDSACVMMGGLRSDWFDLSLGVKQGDICSPILFSCYINGVVDLFNQRPDLGVDLGDGKKRLAIQLFADDMVLMAESGEMLAEMLDILTGFVDQVRLRLSTGLKQKKSAVMVYGSSVLQQCPLERFYVCGQRIPIVEKYKYLGVTLHNEGDWGPHVKQIRSSIGQRLGEMREIGMSKYGLPARRGRVLIRNEINPILEYASGAWTMPVALERQVETMWNKAVRSAAGVPEFVSVEPLIGDLDVLEGMLHSRWMQFRLLMWHRILRMDDDRMIKRCVMLWMRLHRDVPSLDFNPARYWLDRIIQDLGALQWLDCYGVHDAQKRAALAAIPPSVFKDKLRKALLAKVVMPVWRARMKGKGYLDEYRCAFKDPKYIEYQIPNTQIKIWKKECVFKSYLDDTEDKALVQFHTLLRANALPLQTFRQPHFRCGGKDASDLCFMCGTAREDLNHFMNECPAYNGIRNGAGPFTLLGFVRAPSKSRKSVKLLFEMWRLRIRTWRRAHPEQDPVQRLF